MQVPNLLDHTAQAYTAAAGAVLRRRRDTPPDVLHLNVGRVLVCLREGEQIRHQLGVLQGPCWLDAGPALLGQPCDVDMVADTEVQFYRQPLAIFRQWVDGMPLAPQSLLHDLAAGYRQQTQLTISRLAQDAQARCAQWLLHHAQPDAGGDLRVTLQERKCLIAAQLGIAPETFSRVLRNLREHGLVRGSGKVLSLPRPGALQAVALG